MLIAENENTFVFYFFILLFFILPPPHFFSNNFVDKNALNKECCNELFFLPSTISVIETLFILKSKIRFVLVTTILSY